MRPCSSPRASPPELEALVRGIVCPRVSESFRDMISWMEALGPGVRLQYTPVEVRVLCRGDCFVEIIPHREALQVRFGLEPRWEVRIRGRQEAGRVAHEILRALCRERPEHFLDTATP